IGIKNNRQKAQALGPRGKRRHSNSLNVFLSHHPEVQPTIIDDEDVCVERALAFLNKKAPGFAEAF
ncbi:MAG: hypothetical protein K2X47_18480, partial [Bdellovibrionales bacterium]|nr:hypothetical protein [Bdellovibrionales bacterium]